MEVRARIDGYWETIGETPGTVHVPEGEELEILLWLRESNCEDYNQELRRLRIARVELRPDTDRLQKYRNIGLFDDVTSLTVRGYDYSIENLSALAGLSDLRELNLTPSCDLKDLSGLADLPNLTSLHIGWCPRLKSLKPLASLEALTDLRLPNGLKDDELQWLHEQGILERLESLTLTQGSWDDLSAIAELKGLTSLGLIQCSNLSDVSALKNMPNLKGCHRLKDLAPLANLKELTTLNLPDCRD